jgi:hypothetical protein
MQSEKFKTAIQNSKRHEGANFGFSIAALRFAF